MRSNTVSGMGKCALVGASLLMLTAGQVWGDKAADLRRVQLANVKRIAVVPLFFGSETLREKKAADTKPSDKLANPKPDAPPAPEDYRRLLQKMTDRAGERLPERVAERTPFEVVPEKELTAALKSAELTPFALFQNNALIKGTKAPAPDAETIRKLAKALKADVLLLGLMDEPRRNNGGMSAFSGGSLLSFNPSHVSSRITYFVVLPDGTDVFRYTIDAARPHSRTSSRDYVMVDWMETVDQNIENFLDEFARFVPQK
jgi:hypothetical protein